MPYAFTSTPGCISKGRRPEGFDLSMEILSSLPLAGQAPLSVLAQDFRLPKSGLLAHLKRLQRKYGVLILDDDRDAVLVPRAAVGKVKAATEAYWQRVYAE